MLAFQQPLLEGTNNPQAAMAGVSTIRFLDFFKALFPFVSAFPVINGAFLNYACPCPSQNLPVFAVTS